MKKIKKAALLLVVMVLAVFALAGCGKDNNLYSGYTYDELCTFMEGSMQGMVMSLEQSTPEELASYAQSYTENGQEVYANLFNTWVEYRPGVGDFVSMGDFSDSKSGKSLTFTQTINYEERPLLMTYVFSYNKLDQTLKYTDMSVDLVYTTGEKMSKAGMNTLLCMGVVFAVLILISIIISAFNLIPKIQKAFAKNEPAPEEKKDFVEQVAERESSVATDDTELVAVIAAAVAMDTGLPADGFVVRSIRRR